jgi:hypothetical protein
MGKGNVARVNELLKKTLREERVFKGKGYYYIGGGDTNTWHETVLAGSNLAACTFEQAISSVEHQFALAGVTLNLKRGIGR